MRLAAERLRPAHVQRLIGRSGQVAAETGRLRSRPHENREKREHGRAAAEAQHDQSPSGDDHLVHPGKRGARFRSVDGLPLTKFVERTIRNTSRFELGWSNAAWAGLAPNR